MAKVELKQPIVDEIKALAEDSRSVILVDYRGLTVAEDTALRKELREAGVVYKVYKNTLMKRAFEGTDYEQLDGCLAGPSAVAFGKDDATAPARILAKYVKNSDVLDFKGGVVEGTFYDEDGIMAIAAIPSREELISRLLGSMKSPIANFARVIRQIAEKDGGGEAAAAE